MSYVNYAQGWLVSCVSQLPHAGIVGGECVAAVAGGINAILWHDLSAGICQLQVCSWSVSLTQPAATLSHPKHSLFQSGKGTAVGRAVLFCCADATRPFWWCCKYCLLLRAKSIVPTSQALSTVGRCQTFEATADGYGRGEAFTAAIFREASGSDALPLALVKGSAVNQDGRSSSLTAPNGPSQQVSTDAP